MHKPSTVPDPKRLRWLLPLALASASGCAKSPCGEEPSYAGCGKLRIQTDDLTGQSQVRRIAGDVLIRVLGLLPETALDGNTKLYAAPELPNPVEVNGAKARDIKAVLDEQLDTGATLSLSSAAMQSRFFQVSVTRGSQNAERTDCMLHAPPLLSEPTSLVAPRAYVGGASVQSVMMQPGSDSPGLYVVEQFPTSRKLARYKYDANARELVGDSSFGQVLVSERGDGDYRGLFAMSSRTGLSYRYEQSKDLLKLMQMVPTFAEYSELVPVPRPGTSSQKPNILAADPITKTRMLVDPDKIFVFESDYYDLPSNPFQSLTSLNTQTPQSYLVAAHTEVTELAASAPSVLFDAVSVDASNKLQIYELSSDKTVLKILTASTNSSTSFNAALSDAANTALTHGPEGLGSSSIVGLAVADIDQDGLPDLVLALQDNAKTTSEIGWLRYVGKGVFASLSRAKLAAPLTGVTSLSVGDLDGDKLLDVALSSQTTVQVYLNQNRDPNAK